MATITTTELAAELDTTTRELRKFLRSDASGIASVGKGARYSIEKREVRSLRSKFAKWDEARKAPVEDEAPETDNSDETPNED